MEKLKIAYPVLVEGKYDKIKLDSVLEATVITTDGFRVFNHGEKMALVRALAKKTPIIVLTDSDGAGKLIRSHLGSLVPPDRLIQLYIPQIKGKEKRKERPSAEGTLGVEGMKQQLLYDLLAPLSDPSSAARMAENPLSKVDFFEDGLTGAPNSTARRDELATSLGLPRGMTPNALLAALRFLLSYEQYLSLVGRPSTVESDRDHAHA